MARMDFEVVVDASQAERFVRRLLRDDLPFVESLAVNMTAKDFQKAQREHMGDVFTIRRQSFMRRSVKIKPFSSKRQSVREAKVAIDSPGGRSDIFGKFEEGGTKRPTSGTRLAVPAEVRRTKTGVVSKAQRPRRFDFQLSGRSRGAEVYRGRRKTFMIRRPDGTGGIFQRKGDQVRTLYRFTPEAEIEPTLRFFENAERIVRDRFDVNFSRAWDKALSYG